MNIKLTKSAFHQFLFAVSIAVAYSNNYELIFCVWSLCVLLSVSTSYSVYILKMATIFLLVIAVALFASFFHNMTLYGYIRDLTYLIKPLLGLLVGYQLLKKITPSRVFPCIIYTGLLISLFHLSVIFLAFLQLKTLNVNMLREHGGYFSDYEIYVLIILIFQKKFSLNFSAKKLYLLLFITAFSSFLYLSRTNMIQFFIFLIGMKGYFTINKKSITAIITILLATVVGYSAIVYVNPKRNGRGLEAFLYKIKIAPVEAFKTRIDKDDWKDFNDNFRSFESIMTIKQVTSQGVPVILFGEGLGSTIDLGRKVFTNDGEEIRHMPIVHNGYMTIFLKSGLVGVTLIIYSIFLLFRRYRTDDPLIKNINYLLVGTGIFMIFAYWVFLGLYFRADCKSIVIGLLIAYREKLLRDERAQLSS